MKSRLKVLSTMCNFCEESLKDCDWKVMVSRLLSHSSMAHMVPLFSSKFVRSVV